MSTVLALSLWLACSTQAPAPAATASLAPAAPAPAAPAAAPARPADMATTAAPAAWKAPELPACTEIALLVKYDYAYVQQNYCNLCKHVDEHACVLDWPSSDVPSCAYFDQMRNGIYAYYGYTFQKEEWKKHFGAQPWYTPDPNYDAARMSPEATRNIALLKTMAEKKQGCM